MSSEPLFNNREVAIGVWFAAFLIYLVSNRSMRPALRALIRTFFQPPILTLYGLMLAYITLMVWGLNCVGLWEVRQLKDTAIWVLVVAAGSFFSLPKSADDPIFFKNALKDNLRFIVIVEFIIALYPGSLLFELAFVPLTTFLGLMIVFTERDRKYAQVASLLSTVAAILGAAVIGVALYQLISDLLAFATLETLSDFGLPPLLTVLFLPFIFFTTVYMNYERDFRLVGMSIKDPGLRKRAKRKAFFAFRWRTSLLGRWRRELSIRGCGSDADIERSIQSVLERRARERNPPIVSKSEGWSPYKAKEFLATQGLAAGYYEPVLDGEWYASKSRNASDHDSLTTFEYYVEGDAIRATKLGVVMDAFDPEARVADIQELVKLMAQLYEAALQRPVGEDLVEEVLTKDAVERVVDGKTIGAKNTPRDYGHRKGFSIEFSIAAGRQRS